MCDCNNVVCSLVHVLHSCTVNYLQYSFHDNHVQIAYIQWYVCFIAKTSVLQTTVFASAVNYMNSTWDYTVYP